MSGWHRCNMSEAVFRLPQLTEVISHLVSSTHESLPQFPFITFLFDCSLQHHFTLKLFRWPIETLTLNIPAGCKHSPPITTLLPNTTHTPQHIHIKHMIKEERGHHMIHMEATGMNLNTTGSIHQDEDNHNAHLRGVRYPSMTRGQNRILLLKKVRWIPVERTDLHHHEARGSFVAFITVAEECSTILTERHELWGIIAMTTRVVFGQRCVLRPMRFKWGWDG